MNQEDVLRILKLCSLLETEARLYYVLVRRGELSAGELHRITGINRSRTYGILSEMVAKGYCSERVEGKRRFYRALSPSELSEMIFLKRERETEQIKELFTELVDIYNNNDHQSGSLDNIKIVRNPDQLNFTYIDLLSNAKSEILAFVRPPFAAFTKKQYLEEQEKVFYASLDNGVKMRSVYQMDENNANRLLPVIQNGIDVNEDVRLVASLPLKMFVFDRTKVLITIPDLPDLDDSEYTIMVIEDPGQVSVYTDLFERYYNAGTSLDHWKKVNLINS